MQTINVHEAKTHLSRYLEQAAKGEEFILSKNGHPMARLIPFEPTLRVKRELGGVSGWIADDFDDADEAIAALFNNSPIFPESSEN